MDADPRKDTDPYYLRARDDPHAAGELWEHLQDSVAALSRSYLPEDPAEAESLAGEVFTKMLAAFNGDGAFRAFFCQRLKFALIEARRRRSRDRHVPTPGAAPTPLMSLGLCDPEAEGSCSAPAPWAALASEEEIGRAFKAAYLTERQEAVARACWLEDMKYAEAGEKLGLTVAQVRNDNKRAREKMLRAAARGHLDFLAENMQ